MCFFCAAVHQLFHTCAVITGSLVSLAGPDNGQSHERTRTLSTAINRCSYICQIRYFSVLTWQIGLMSTLTTVSVSCHATHRSSYVTLLHQLLALGYSGQTAVKQDAVVNAVLCVKVRHQSVWKELLQPYCLPIKCNRTSNSGGQMKTIILVVSASAVTSVGCHCVPPCLHSGKRKTRSDATCGTSQSLYGSQPWSRRVAVFCSHRSQTWRGELGSYCEGHDFMFCSPPPSPYWLRVQWQHRLHFSLAYVHRQGQLLATRQMKSCWI